MPSMTHAFTYEAASKHIEFVQYVFEELSFFLGGQIVLQGFPVFGTILNFHHVETSKILSESEFAQGHTPGDAGLLVIKYAG